MNGLKLVVLGAAGTIGEEATVDLVETSTFSEICLADSDYGRAKELGTRLKDRRVTVSKVDATKPTELLDLLREFDIVTNALPFRFDLPVTRAAIRAKISGVDLFTTKEQLALNGPAKKQNVTFVCGCGMSPGLTNVLARKGSENLDSVDAIRMFWAAFRCTAPAPGLLYTTFWEFNPLVEDRLYYKDGRYVAVPPFAGAEQVEFSSPIGPQVTYYVPHPEAVTIPQFIKGVRKVEVKGTWPAETMRLLRTVLDFGFYKNRPVRIHNKRIRAMDFIFQYLLKSQEAKETKVWGFGVNVQVIGEKDRQKTRYTYLSHIPNTSGWIGKRAYTRSIGIPLSVSTQLVAEGKIKQNGVSAPEGAFDPDDFLRRIESRGIKVTERKEQV